MGRLQDVLIVGSLMVSMLPKASGRGSTGSALFMPC